LKHNFLPIQLIEFCFSICGQESSKLTLQIVQASSLFSPSSILIPTLAFIARESFGERQRTRFWMKYQFVSSCMCMTTTCPKSSEIEVLAMLVKFHIA